MGRRKGIGVGGGDTGGGGEDTGGGGEDTVNSSKYFRQHSMELWTEIRGKLLNGDQTPLPNALSLPVMVH